MDEMLKIPISFFNETEYMNYQKALYSEDQDEDLEDWEIEMKKSQRKPIQIKQPKTYKTDLYMLKSEISAFHAAFQRTDSEKLDGTAIFTRNGDIHISTLSCAKFLKIYNGVQTIPASE